MLDEKKVLNSVQYVPPYSARRGRLQFGMGFPGIRVVLKYVAAISEQEMLKDERSSNDL